MKIFKYFMVLVLVVLLIGAAGCGGKTEDPSGNGAVEENGTGSEDENGSEDESNSGQGSGIGEAYFASMGGWKHCDFKPGQFMKYNVTTARGLEGWVSIKVDSGEGDDLDLTIEGLWLGDISETATLTRGMLPEDFVYEKLSAEALNIAGALLQLTHIPFNKAKWEEGFRWEDGDQILEVGGEETYAGLTGRVVTYESPNSFTGQTQHYKYVINLDFPLPLYIEKPGANDTFYYELAEISGF
ncbi:MAG: hypothetical protein WBK48_10030 [Dethiobacteria bacterium]|jgi:hypothetical protein|nr:hypothetical protein [Bacillota bacterium]HOP69737.1 hypothetical protein [Bacillota bacterium]HPT34632.1 hypothetical protein [Bacillota bacterium]